MRTLLAMVVACCVLRPSVTHAEALTIVDVKTQGEGALTPDQVRRFVQTKIPKLLGCNRQQGATGTLRLSLLINSSGHVITSSAELLGNKTVEDCAARVMRNSRVSNPRFTKARVDLKYAPERS